MVVNPNLKLLQTEVNKNLNNVIRITFELNTTISNLIIKLNIDCP